MAHERLLDKNNQPTEAEMLAAIGQPLDQAWSELRAFLEQTYQIEPIYNSGGARYGWNLQYRKGGRPLCEMYPEHGSFTVLVVLGKKELEQALARQETFSALVSRALVETPRFHDGCWMYLRLSDPQTGRQEAQDIAQLVLLKKKPAKK